MLILPNGWKEYEDRRNNYDLRHESDPTPIMEQPGFKVNNEDVDTREAQALTPTQWKLPWNFCADCARTDITKDNVAGPGGILFDEPRPEINMRPGEALIYWTCRDCLWKNRRDPAANLVLPGADRHGITMDRQARIQQHIIDFVKMLRFRGEEPLTRV